MVTVQFYTAAARTVWVRACGRWKNPLLTLHILFTIHRPVLWCAGAIISTVLVWLVGISKSTGLQRLVSFSCSSPV